MHFNRAVPYKHSKHLLKALIKCIWLSLLWAKNSQNIVMVVATSEPRSYATNTVVPKNSTTTLPSMLFSPLWVFFVCLFTLCYLLMANNNFSETFYTLLGPSTGHMAPKWLLVLTFVLLDLSFMCSDVSWGKYIERGELDSFNPIVINCVSEIL